MKAHGGDFGDSLQPRRWEAGGVRSGSAGGPARGLMEKPSRAPLLVTRAPSLGLMGEYWGPSSLAGAYRDTPP